MALLETYGEPERDRQYDCPKYVPDAGGKRCRHYLEGGACALDSEFMCVLWMRANGHPVPAEHPVASPPQTDLFGATGSPPKATPRTKAKTSTPTKAVATSPDRPVNGEEQRQLEPIAKDDIDSFKALGVEVCLHAEALGDVWIVPEYTGQERKEISIEHAATLYLVVSAFPGSKVTSFEKQPPAVPSDREETPA